MCPDRCSKCCWQNVYTYSSPLAVVVTGGYQHRLATVENDTAVAPIQLRTFCIADNEVVTCLVCLFCCLRISFWPYFSKILHLHKNVRRPCTRYLVKYVLSFLVIWHHPFSVIEVLDSVYDRVPSLALEGRYVSYIVIVVTMKFCMEWCHKLLQKGHKALFLYMILRCTLYYTCQSNITKRYG